MVSLEQGLPTLTAGRLVNRQFTQSPESVTKTGNFAESTRQVVNEPGSIFTTILEMSQPEIPAPKLSAILPLLSLG